MEPNSNVTLIRDCPASAIPSGTPVTLPAGTTVHITQTLGGQYTVRTEDGLFLISGKDAVALGQDPLTATPAAPVSGPVGESDIWGALKTCYDPEIPVNIVDLGLVYDLTLDSNPGGGANVRVKMTLTAPGCGMGGVIARDAQQKILALPGVEQAEVELVWDPPWHQSMITAEGRRILGLPA
jgi:probable FeS assembly SUF system protein SufT